MSLLLQIATPHRVVLEKKVKSVTVPTELGEITILARHIPLLTLLNEGILKIKDENNEEEFYAIGRGYLQTNGKKVMILVARAFGQSEINEKIIEESKKKAEELMKRAIDDKLRQEAASLLRRSIIENRLLQKVRKKRS